MLLTSYSPLERMSRAVWSLSTVQTVGRPPPDPGPGGGETCHGAVPDELPLELSQGTEDVDHQPPAGGAGGDGLGQADERNVAGIQCLHRLDEVLEGPPKSVQPPNDDGVARSSRGE